MLSLLKHLKTWDWTIEFPVGRGGLWPWNLHLLNSLPLEQKTLRPCHTDQGSPSYRSKKKHTNSRYFWGHFCQQRLGGSFVWLLGASNKKLLTFSWIQVNRTECLEKNAMISGSFCFKKIMFLSFWFGIYCGCNLLSIQVTWLVVSTHLKNITVVKMGIFSNFRVKIKNLWDATT